MNNGKLILLLQAVCERDIQRETARLQEKWKDCVTFDRARELAAGAQKTEAEVSHVTSGCPRCMEIIEFHRVVLRRGVLTES